MAHIGGAETLMKLANDEHMENLAKWRAVEEMEFSTPEDIQPRVGGFALEEFNRNQLLVIARYLHSRSQARLMSKLSRAQS